MKKILYEKFPKNNLKAKSIVVLLHGIGADGFDLISLAQLWGKIFKETQFYSLHAPYDYDLAEFGKQWFSLKDRDQTRILKEIELVKPLIFNFLDEKLKKNNIGFDKLVLVGFGQGTMISLNTGLSFETKIKGILGYSGGVILTKSGKIDVKSKPNICLIHGNDDEVVPKKMMLTTKDILEEKAVSVESHIIPNLGHGINDEGVKIGIEFLNKNLI